MSSLPYSRALHSRCDTSANGYGADDFDPRHPATLGLVDLRERAPERRESRRPRRSVRLRGGERAGAVPPHASRGRRIGNEPVAGRYCYAASAVDRIVESPAAGFRRRPRTSTHVRAARVNEPKPKVLQLMTLTPAHQFVKMLSLAGWAWATERPGAVVQVGPAARRQSVDPGGTDGRSCVREVGSALINREASSLDSSSRGARGAHRPLQRVVRRRRRIPLRGLDAASDGDAHARADIESGRRRQPQRSELPARTR
jgi:hypothetical protein